MELHLESCSRTALPSDVISEDPPYEKSECSICLGYFEPEGSDDHWKSKLVELKCNNKHKYHLKCMKEWTIYKDECPLCKVKINPI